MKIDALPLLEIVQTELARSNEEGYLVGGSVRDILLRRQTVDFDFAVQKSPKQLAERLAKKTRGTLLQLKEEREIYRVVTRDNFQLDIAKFKGKTIEDDLKQRDFTINAMAIKIDAQFKIQDSRPDLLDPFEGRKDLEKKLVRQISESIYEDDPLRLLRAFRMAAQLGFEIEEWTLHAIHKNKKKITQSSWERIREELLLILDCPQSIPFLKKMDTVGLISELLPEMEPNRNCALEYYPGKGVWGHSLDGLECLEWIFENLESEFPEHFEKISALIFGKQIHGHPLSTLMKIGILLHDVGKAATAKRIEGRLRFFEHQEVGAKIAKTISKRWRFSSDAVAVVSQLVAAHMRLGGLAIIPEVTERAKYRFFRDLGEVAIPMILVSLADRYSYLAPHQRGKKLDRHEKISKELLGWHFNRESKKPTQEKQLLNGDILMKKFGLTPSPLIGEILRSVAEARALGEIQTPMEALEFAKKFLKTKSHSSPSPTLSLKGRG